jgi:uncharacterized protein
MPASDPHPALATRASGAAKLAAALPIHIYRWTLKPLLGHECRHLPTCSQYALDAIARNGAWRGGWLAVSRLCRCHPWGTHGFDPAPDLSDRHYRFTPWRYGVWRAQRERREPPRL